MLRALLIAICCCVFATVSGVRGKQNESLAAATPAMSQVTTALSEAAANATRSPLTRCGPNHFQCWDGACVPRDKFCDGHPDCLDESDESVYISVEILVLVPCFPVGRAGSQNFCSLWNNNWICDGVSHCMDDMDEICADHCPDLPVAYVCNGYPNCPGLCDDPNTESSHLYKGEFLGSGYAHARARYEKSRTRGDWNPRPCPNPTYGSDEANCTLYSCGQDTNVTVLEGELCNSILDCPDGRDECLPSCKDCNYCNGVYDICEDGEICQVSDLFCSFCDDNQTKYHSDQICDGVLNCPNADDEIDCNKTVICGGDNMILPIETCIEFMDCGEGGDEICSICPITNRVITNHDYCDGINDCGDHSDECNNHCPSKSKFICGSGECISRSCFCDGVIDCADMSDEITGNLTEGIMCDNVENKHEASCLLRQDSWLCDLVDHCHQRVDECQPDCHKASFWCDNGKCIGVESFCNGVEDCEDGTDETQYRGQHGQFACRAHQFGFGVGRACALDTQHPWVCDGLVHCANRSDECMPECELSYLCGSGECIKRDWVCDGDRDCADGSDEQTDQSETFTCTKTRHPLTRTCLLPLSIVRDNVSDCDRDMDLLGRTVATENAVDVDFLPNPDTLMGHAYFQCKGEKRIIPGEKQCDGHFDCVLLSDECMCENSPKLCTSLCYGTESTLDGGTDPCQACDVGQVMCDQKCIDRRQVCDGSVDCYDGTDEVFCTPDIQCATGETEHCKPDFVCHSVHKDKNQNQTALACDGRPECQHYEDECDTCPDPLPAFCQRISDQPLFNVRFYSCDTGGVLLAASDICDGLSLDCPDGGDELHCPHRIYCNSSAGLEDLRENGGPIHISKSQICDGKIDCKNQMDEANCSGHFYCESGQPLFVPIRGKTDGKADCIDGSDECPSNSFSDDVFASREHMIRDPALRYLIWVMGGLSIIGNLAVLGETLYDLLLSKDRFKNKRPFAKVNHVLVLNLATADLLMGIYLVILGSVAASTSGSYCLEDKSWRSSQSCSVLGVVTIVSCVTSVLMLVILTSYRLYGVVRPFKCQHVSYVTALMFAALAWCIALLLALLPIAEPFSSRFISHAWIRHNPYFVSDLVDRSTLQEFARRLPLFYTHDAATFDNATTPGQVIAVGTTWKDIETTMHAKFGSESIRGVFGYYSAHSVCIPKLYVTSDDVGWVQSMVIIIFNFAAFIYIVASYVYIFYKTNATKTRRSRQNSMLRRISYLVASDLACWIPICVMSFMNLAGAAVPENAYAISAVILLPINSALNPLLYSNVIQRIVFKIVTCGKGTLESEVTKPHDTRDHRSSDKGSSRSGSREPSLKSKRPQQEKLHLAMSAMKSSRTDETMISSVKSSVIKDQEATTPML